MMDQLKNALSDHGIKLSYTEGALHVIAENSYSSKYGARNMRRYIQKNIEDEIANEIIGRYENAVSMITVDADESGNGIAIRCI
jgi:ATP-dependent Clp protease ATP-binding subunit ClpB